MRSYKKRTLKYRKSRRGRKHGFKNKSYKRGGNGDRKPLDIVDKIRIAEWNNCMKQNDEKICREKLENKYGISVL
jgi:hypothetical protein